MPVATPTRRRFLARALQTFGALAFALTFLRGSSCTKAGQINGPKSLDGTWTVIKVDADSTTPYDLPSNTQGVSAVNGGTLTLTGSNFTLSLAVTQNGTLVQQSTSGTFTRNARQLGFTGTVNGQTATIPGVILANDYEIKMTTFIGGGTHDVTFILQ